MKAPALDDLRPGDVLVARGEAKNKYKVNAVNYAAREADLVRRGDGLSVSVRADRIAYLFDWEG